MKEAQSVYELFEEADTDRSGTISKEEFIRFGSSIDVPTEEEALALFTRVDTDKNGEDGGGFENGWSCGINSSTVLIFSRAPAIDVECIIH